MAKALQEMKQINSREYSIFCKQSQTEPYDGLHSVTDFSKWSANVCFLPFH